MVEVHGECEPSFEPVREQLRAGLESGDEVGASLCVIQDGRLLLDLWGGLADRDTGVPWERDTLANTFSITKTMTALAALLLVDAGELDLDARVTTYWPEFGAAGKAEVLVRHVLGHTSGVSGWQEPVTLADIYDLEHSTALLAAQEPWWTPGRGSGYHAVNQGHLVGELVRRITGRSLGAFFAAEIAGPMDADFYIGTPPSVDDRIATMIPPPAAGIDYGALPAESVVRKSLLNPVLDVRQVRTREWRAAEIGAANGHGNARSVAQIQALISHGGALDGAPTLRDTTIARIFDVQADGLDRVLGVPIKFGIGYGLANGETTPDLPSGRVCWWTGYGGSIVINDLDRRLTVAYIMNKMGPALVGLARSSGYLRPIYAAVDAKDDR